MGSRTSFAPLLTLAMAAAAFAPTQAAAQARPPADSVDEYVLREMKRRNIPGASMVVMKNGQVVRSAGYGLANIELQVPATPETVYEIGSISKQFAAEAVMLLVEEGKVQLDDPVNRYLPVRPERWDSITIRHILNHTSGIKDWDTQGTNLYRSNPTPEDFIRTLATPPLDFAPGSRWAYTNSGFPLLGMVVERASGLPYERFVTERIFAPAGMTSTRFKHPEDVVPRRAAGYVWSGGQWKNGEQARPSIIAPNGGVMSTVGDLARWQTALFEGRIVRPATLAQMLTPARLNDGTSPRNHGFAWFMDAFNGHPTIFHPGATVGGFGAQVYRMHEDSVTVIVLTNLNDGAFGADAISKRVGGFHVPGAHAAFLPVRPDPSPATTERLRRVLRAIAAGETSELLAPGLRGGVPASWRDTVSSHLPRMTGFGFLTNEVYTPRYFPRGPGSGRVVRYRATVGGDEVFYHFYLDRDDLVEGLMIEPM